MTARPTTSVSDTLLAALPGDWPGLTGCRAPSFGVPSLAASPFGAPPFGSSPLARTRCPGDPGGRRSAPAAGEFAARGFGTAPRGAAVAREFTGRTLREWGLAALVDDAAVVVSELVGNALRYGVTALPRRPSAERPVRLGLLRQSATLLCAVSDPSSAPPVVKEPDHFAETGRGLHIVDSLSQKWGWSPPDVAGKTVWAVLGAPR